MSEFKGILSASEYIEKVYGMKNFTRTLELKDSASLIDLMDDYENYNYNISQVPEMLEMLKQAKTIIGMLRRSMSVHPDCTAGSEFDDYTSLAQEFEDEIEDLIKEVTEV